jgi:hypothetical protein
MQGLRKLFLKLPAPLGSAAGTAVIRFAARLLIEGTQNR